ncbi:TPA: hypothetical protein RTG66_001772, partial [Campylobacter jejuni]|nr:hypothetical protein [Campylobacter jejuni]
MTQKQFNEIKKRLAKWRKERHLTYENQQEGFLGNLFEELSEYYRAKNDLERVDAICDIAIFVFNSTDINYRFYSNFIDSAKYCSDLSYIFRNIKAIVRYHEGYEEINYITENNSHLISILEKICEKNLGFDFYKCMIETI